MSHNTIKEKGTVGVSQWDGCYDSSWKGIITPAAFAHP